MSVYSKFMTLCDSLERLLSLSHQAIEMKGAMAHELGYRSKSNNVSAPGDLLFPTTKAKLYKSLLPSWPDLLVNHSPHFGPFFVSA
jgi:hypothetical protein